MNGLRAPVLVVWLTALWVLLWGDLTVQNLAAGVVIALVVVVIAWPTGARFTAATSFHPVAALRYLVYFAGQLVVSNLVVAREIVTPGSSLNRAIVAVPMHTSSAAINTLVANCVTLTPGTLTVDAVNRVHVGQAITTTSSAIIAPAATLDSVSSPHSSTHSAVSHTTSTGVRSPFTSDLRGRPRRTATGRAVAWPSVRRARTAVRRTP